MPTDVGSVLSLGTIDCAYFLALLAGVIWAVFALLAGGLGDSHDAGAGFHHIDTFDSGSVHVSPISPIVLSSFITSFGGAGIVSRHVFHVSGPLSLLWATFVGLALASLMFLFYSKFLIASQGSSEVRVSQLVGLTAEVTVPISATGVGEITLVASGSRVTYPARSAGGDAIPPGAQVVIEQMPGPVAVVRLKPP